jgi:hypothetical protein
VVRELISKRGNAVDRTHDEHAVKGLWLPVGVRTPLTRRPNWSLRFGVLGWGSPRVGPCGCHVLGCDC